MVALTTLAAVVAMVVLSVAVASAAATYGWSSEIEHTAGHTALAVPLLVLVVAAVRLWPAPRPTLSARRARLLIVAGLAVVSLGQLCEALGAFGYADDERTHPLLATLHDIGVLVGPVGLLVVTVGVALTLHRSSRGVGVADVAIVGLGVVGIAGLFFGIPVPLAVVLVVGAVAITIVRTKRSRRVAAERTDDTNTDR